jgi:hypothetical protein
VGYKPKRTLYRLTFEDPDLEGLVVVTRRPSVDGLLRFVELYEQVQGLDEDSFKPEDMKLLTTLFERFVKVLTEWNVEDDEGQPVPRTVEGLQSLELDFTMQIIESWITGMFQAPPPLPPGSPGGGIPPEASLPMEVLPPSPVS